MQAQLGRGSAAKTREYLKRLKEKPGGKRRIRSRLRAGETPERGPGRAQPRNHLALRHGLTARYLPELERLEEQGVQLKWPFSEILRWKVVALRALILGERSQSLEENIRLLDVAGIAAMRITKIVYRLNVPAKRRRKKPAIEETQEAWEWIFGEEAEEAREPEGEEAGE